MTRTLRPRSRSRTRSAAAAPPIDVVHLSAEWAPFARTGGLAEAVVDGETGFVFDACDAAALDGALDRALACWGDRAAREALTARAMRVPAGWDARVPAYRDVHASVRRRPVATAVLPAGAADELLHPPRLARARG